HPRRCQLAQRNQPVSRRPQLFRRRGNREHPNRLGSCERTRARLHPSCLGRHHDLESQTGTRLETPGLAIDESDRTNPCHGRGFILPAVPKADRRGDQARQACPSTSFRGFPASILHQGKAIAWIKPKHTKPRTAIKALRGLLTYQKSKAVAPRPGITANIL